MVFKIQSRFFHSLIILIKHLSFISHQTSDHDHNTNQISFFFKTYYFMLKDTKPVTFLYLHLANSVMKAPALATRTKKTKGFENWIYKFCCSFLSPEATGPHAPLTCKRKALLCPCPKLGRIGLISVTDFQQLQPQKRDAFKLTDKMTKNIPVI